MEYFPFLKECLKKFNYPNIHSLNDLEIFDIFSSANRHFLVSWILKQIDGGYDEVLLNISRDDLAAIIYHSGFCRFTEKDQFMSGECDSIRQFEILYKMFTYMNSLFNNMNADKMKPFSEEEVKDLRYFDTNLFPVYGNKQTLNSLQRAKKIKEYQKEMEQLRHLVDSKRSKQFKEALLWDYDLKKKLAYNMKILEMNLPNFKRATVKFMKNRNQTVNRNLTFKENLPNTLENCNKSIANILQLIQSMNSIMNFNEDETDTTDLTDNSNDKSKAILGEVSCLCHLVTAVIRNE